MVGLRALTCVCMQQSYSWQANSCLGIQFILRSRTVCCHVHKSQSWFISRAKLIKPTPSHSVHLKYILILKSHLHLNLPTCLFPSGLPVKILSAVLISLKHATYLFKMLRNFTSTPPVCIEGLIIRQWGILNLELHPVVY